MWSDGAIPIPFATGVEGKTVVGVRSGTGPRVITGALKGTSRVWNSPASTPITNAATAGTTQRFNTGPNRGPNRKAWVVGEVESGVVVLFERCVRWTPPAETASIDSSTALIAGGSTHSASARGSHSVAYWSRESSPVKSSSGDIGDRE